MENVASKSEDRERTTMKKKYLVAPNNGAPDCYHSGFPSFTLARLNAQHRARIELTPYAVFEKIGIARPEKLIVNFSKCRGGKKNEKPI